MARTVLLINIFYIAKPSMEGTDCLRSGPSRCSVVMSTLRQSFAVTWHHLLWPCREGDHFSVSCLVEI